jgi:2-polyprenyl-3-methyl-5-hydroxy-6-metoxy-1,4-benzoquinol methylase
MPDFSQRSADVEMMDDLNCSGAIVDQTLAEIETINKLLGGNDVTISSLEHIPLNSTGIVTLADLGCGGGDMLKRIRRWSQRHNVNMRLIGIDANPNIIDFARRNTSPDEQIEYYTLDIFSEEFKKHTFDIVVGTLFFHHFPNKQLIGFFQQLRQQVKRVIIMNDIHRHWFAYYSIRFLTRLLSKSPMVRFDAPLSVLRAFTKEDLQTILDSAGFKNYTIKWRWAFRWQVIINV